MTARAAMKTIIYLDETCRETFGWNWKDSLPLTKDDFYDYFTMTGTLFDFDGKYVYWIGMDNGNVPDVFRRNLYSKLSALTDKLDQDALIINGTHTHSGPRMTRTRVSMHGASEEDCYMDFIEANTDKAVQMFKELEGQLQEFTSQIAVVPIEGCYGNRNNLDLPADKDVNLIALTALNGERIGILMELTTHSTIIFPKNPKMTTDLVGNVRTKVSELYDCPVLPFVGCAGDSSTRLTRQRSKDPALDHSELLRLRDEITAQIKEKAVFEDVVIDRFEAESVELSYSYTLNPETMKKRLVKLEEQIAAEKNPQQLRLLLQSKESLEKRILGPFDAQDTLIGRAYNFGEIKIGVFPGELVASLGLQIISHQPHEHHLVMGYTPDGVGYLVEIGEYGKNFESINSKIPVGLPEVLTWMIKSKVEEF